MRTFLQWAEESGYELPIITDTKPKAKASKEHRVRTGVSHNYPDAYVRAQYPDGYYPPTKATAALDLKQKAASYNGQRAAN